MILAFLEQEAGVPSGLGTEAVAFAGALAARLDQSLEVVVVGPGAEEAVAGAAPPAEVVHVGLTGLGSYAPRAIAHVLAELAAGAAAGAVAPGAPTGGAVAPGAPTGGAAAGAATAVVAPGSERGNEVMAYLAAMTDLPLATNCVELDPATEPSATGGTGPWRLTRNRWAGSLLEDAELDPGPGRPRLLTVALGASPPGPPRRLPGAGAPAVRPVGTVADDADLAAAVTEVVQPSGAGVSLGDARVIVSGGRGVGGEAGFAALEELAALLGGTVGCSRVVTSEGWRPHRDQVGQTGTRVSPELYIACGISGAIQHMVGCKGARRILAINTDPDAPIMGKADYAVVGDLHDVVPAVIAEIRRLRGPGA